MVQDMREGLIVELLIGAGQTNILGGEFSGNVLLGYKVERGEIVGRVKDAILSGNVYRVLAELIDISSERKWVGGSIYTPALYCSNLAVATKG
jgi:PmbA protein